MDPVNQALVGGLGQAEPKKPGRVLVRGWVADRDNPEDTAIVAIVVDGKTVATMDADRPRPDVAAAEPDLGPDHGFEQVVATPKKKVEVCATATMKKGAAARDIGCIEVSAAR